MSSTVRLRTSAQTFMPFFLMLISCWMSVFTLLLLLVLVFAPGAALKYREKGKTTAYESLVRRQAAVLCRLLLSRSAA